MIPGAWFYNASARKIVNKVCKDLLKEKVTTNWYVVEPQMVSIQMQGGKKNT